MENTTTLPTQKNVPKALSLFFRDCAEMISVSQCFGHAFASPAVRQKSQTSTLFGNPHFGGFAKGSHVLSAMVGGGHGLVMSSYYPETKLYIVEIVC